MQKTYICLNMIVRNEAKNIKRLLNSVKDSIDYYVICDTGSTDDTPKIIEETMQGYGIPGEIHYHDWKNFGHNRTLALYAATLALFEKRHDCDRILVIDADEIIVLDKGKIIEKGTHISLLKNKGFYYYLWKIQSGENNA